MMITFNTFQHTYPIAVQYGIRSSVRSSSTEVKSSIPLVYQTKFKVPSWVVDW